MELLTYVSAFGWIVVLFALVLNVALGLIRRTPPRDVLDTMQRDLDKVQEDRRTMEAMERAYIQATATQQRIIDVLADMLKAAAPYTPTKADDKLVEVLEDMRKPGPPEVFSVPSDETTDAAA